MKTFGLRIVDFGVIGFWVGRIFCISAVPCGPMWLHKYRPGCQKLFKVVLLYFQRCYTVLIRSSKVTRHYKRLKGSIKGFIGVELGLYESFESSKIVSEFTTWGFWVDL